jgi:hypothetical protein
MRIEYGFGVCRCSPGADQVLNPGLIGKRVSAFVEQGIRFMGTSEKQIKPLQSENGFLMPSRENRWCEKHGYFVDFEACSARAKNKSFCRRCLWKWRQLPLPLPDSAVRH